MGIYLGNPGAHNLSNLLYNRVLLRACRRATSTRPAPSISTQQMASALMYGTGTTIAIRTSTAPTTC